MNDNPLSRICYGLLALNAVTTMYELSRGDVRVTSSLATIGSVVLFILHRRRSVHAASFLFWTTVPVYPVYFTLKWFGLTGRRPTNVTLLLAAAVWVAGLIFAWRLRSKYAAYIAAPCPATGPGRTA